MVWNEPGQKKKKDTNQDPWTGKKGPFNQPPNLDEWIIKLCKKIIQKVRSWYMLMRLRKMPYWGGKYISKRFFLIILAVISLIAWLCAGIIKIQSDEKALLFLAGYYQKTLEPGIHWVPFGIAHAQRVLLKGKIFEADQFLTQDQQLLEVGVTLSYTIRNPKEFLESMANPLDNIKYNLLKAIQMAVATYNLEDFIANKIPTHFDRLIKNNLMSLNSKDNEAIEINTITLNQISLPDRIKAETDKFQDTLKQANEIEEKANKYKLQVESAAHAQVNKILSSLPQERAQEIIEAKIEVAYLNTLLKESPILDLASFNLYIKALENYFNKKISGGDAKKQIPATTFANEENAKVKAEKILDSNVSNTLPIDSSYRTGEGY